MNAPSPSSPDPSTTDVDVVVVGAGFAGLYLIHKLRQQGLSVRVLEAGDGVGGTWYWNRYPGARVDVKSMFYNYSFDDELEQEWEWTEKYPPQPEILRYINHVADRFDLRRDVQLNTQVTAAAFDEDTNRWTVTTAGGEQLRAQFVVMATGCLSSAKGVELPGKDSFAGRSLHTGHWPDEEPDFTGRRVAVIGTGSSGVQVIPLIAEQAASLTVFQRTANFVLPARNHPITTEYQDEIKGRYAEVREANRASAFGLAQPEATRSALEASQEERHAFYDRVWNDPESELVSMLVGFTDTMSDVDSNETAAQFVRDRIAEIVDDPETAKILQPTGYPFGTKRPCLGTNYYETFNRPNVSLVDLRATPLTEVTPTGLRTSEQDFELDDIVYATGYDAMTGALLAMDIRGRGGRSLRDQWSEQPWNYLGLSVPDFPNLFTVTGPGSPSVLSNMLVSIEQHVDWIDEAIATVRRQDCATIEAQPQAADEWTQHVNDVGNMTLYPMADSWYMGANVPGKTRTMYAYIGGVGNYRDKCADVASKGYEGFSLMA